MKIEFTAPANIKLSRASCDEWDAVPRQGDKVIQGGQLCTVADVVWDALGEKVEIKLEPVQP